MSKNWWVITTESKPVCFRDKINGLQFLNSVIFFCMIATGIWNQAANHGVYLYKFFKIISCPKELTALVQAVLFQQWCFHLKHSHYYNWELSLFFLCTCTFKECGVTVRCVDYLLRSKRLCLPYKLCEINFLKLGLNMKGPFE